MSTETAIDFETLRQILGTNGVAAGPAEAQGLLCGLICTGAEGVREIWLRELLPDPDEAGDLLRSECRQALERVYQETHDAFDGPGVGFELLLPDEGQPLRNRAAALTDWCQGYLYGLGLAKAPLGQLSEETLEGLKDITEVTKLDLSALEDGEEAEIDLTEVAEFVWVAAMLVREELVHHPRGE